MTLDRQFRKFLYHKPEWQTVDTIISKIPWKCYLQGGVVRDFLLRNVGNLTVRSRDFDIVVEGCPNNQLLIKTLTLFKSTTNSFGNIKCHLGTTEVDIWRTEVHPGSPHTIKDAICAVTTSLDTVAFDLSNNIIIETNCINSIKNKTIDIANKDCWTPDFIAHRIAHVAKIKAKTRYNLTPQMRKMLLPHINDVNLEKATAFLSRYTNQKKARAWVDDLPL